MPLLVALAASITLGSTIIWFGIESVPALAIGIAVVLAVVLLGPIAVDRFFIAQRNGRTLTTGETIRGVIQRLPYMALWMLLTAVVATLAFGIIVALGFFVSEAIFLLTVPLMIVAVIALASYSFIFSSLLMAGPRDSSLLQTVVDETRNRWGLVFRMIIIAWVIGTAASFATSGVQAAGVNQPIVLIATTALGWLIQMVIGCATTATAHVNLALPTDPALLSDRVSAPPSPLVPPSPQAPVPPPPPPPPPPGDWTASG